MIYGTAAGNLGADPEVRQTGGGTSVCNLRIACNERVKRQGEWVDETTWLNVAVFGGRGEGIAKIARKGSAVVCRGRLTVRTFEKRDGSQGFSFEMVADDVKPMGGGKRDYANDGEPPSRAQQSNEFSDEDNVPF